KVERAGVNELRAGAPIALNGRVADEVAARAIGEPDAGPAVVADRVRAGGIGEADARRAAGDAGAGIVRDGHRAVERDDAAVDAEAGGAIGVQGRRGPAQLRVIHHTNAGELVVVRPQIARHDLRPAGDPQAEDAAGELHAGDVDVLRAADVDRRSAGAGRVDDRRSAAVDRHPLAIADVDRLVASAGHGDRVRAGDVQRAQGALDGLSGIAVDRHIGGPRSPRRCAEYQPGKCRQRYPPAPFGYFVHGNLPYTLSHHSTIAWRP